MNVNIDDFLKKAVSNKLRMKKSLEIFGGVAAKKLEREAKVDAPWEDRTTNARQSIMGYANWEGDDLAIILRGGMDYSIWLELANEKKYAILFPTIEKNRMAILKTVAERLLK